MKLAIFTQNTLQGGLDTFIYNFVKNYPSSWDITIFCNGSHPGLDTLNSIPRDKLNIIPYFFFTAHDIHARKSSLSFFAHLTLRSFIVFFGFPYHVYKIYKLIRTSHFDNFLVVNGGYPGGDACLAAPLAWAFNTSFKKLCFFNYHNLALSYPSSLFRLAKELIIDYLLGLTIYGFISVSKSCKDSILSRTPLALIPNYVIYNGLDFLLPSIQYDIKHEFGLPVDSRIVLILATYEPRKGHLFLFEAMSYVFSKLDNVYLFAFGDSSHQQLNALQQYLLSYKYRDRVYLNPFRKHPQSIIAQSDVLVIPSLSHESFGYTAIEAMSIGIPVVSTDVGGLPEVNLHNQTGFIVNDHDPKVFGSSVLTILENKALAHSMSVCGKLRVFENFAGSRMSALYHSLISGESL